MVTRPSIVSTTPVVVAAGTGITFPNPSGVKSGDYLLVTLRAQNTNTVPPTMPSGWSELGTAFVPSSPSRTNVLLGLPVPDASTLPTTHVFTAIASAVGRIVGHIMVVRNVNLTAPVTAFYDSYIGATQAQGIHIPAYAVTAANSLTVVLASAEFAANADHTLTASDADYTIAASTPSSTSLTVSRTLSSVYYASQDAGSTPDFLIQWAAATSPAGQSITFAGADTYVPPASGAFKTQVWTGQNLADAGVYTYNGTGLDPASNMLTLPLDRVTVDGWLGSVKVESAHRGGSANWPEQTMRAYTNAVWHGAKCLDAAVRVSSDGVLVLCYAPSTLALFGVDYAVADTPWSVLSTLRTTNGGLPMLRLDSLVNTYANTHVIMVEDRTSANMNAVLDVFEGAFVDANTRLILKCDGPTGASQLSRAIRNGYRSWGYFANNDAATMPDLGNVYTAIGIPWDSPAQVFKDTHAVYPGKKILAYVTPNAAAATQAYVNGADGVQTADVLGVIRRLNTLPAQA